MTPEQEERVRRALADAAVARTPMPPDVAGRLDDVLAELVTARQQGSATEDAGATEERRARRWPAVLVAAAVVCLLALVAPAVMRAVSSSDSGSTSSAGAASKAADGRGSAAGTASAPAAPSAGQSPALAQGVLPPPRLHRVTLQRDVRRVLAAVPALASGSTGLTERQNRRTGCKTPPPARHTDVVAVLLDGKPATLVVAPPRQGTRQARVYACEDASAPVATARVAAP